MSYTGRRAPSEYMEIIAEVFYDSTRRKNGVRPIENQSFPQYMKIECAREIRNFPIGTRLILNVVEKNKEDCKPYLYSSYKWAYKLITN